MKTRSWFFAIVLVFTAFTNARGVDFVTFVDDQGYYAPVSAWTESGWVPFTVQTIIENHLVVWTSPVATWPTALDVIGGVRVGDVEWWLGPLLGHHGEVGQVDGWAIHYTHENEWDYGSYFALLYPPAWSITYGLGLEAVQGVWTVGEGFTAMHDVPEPASMLLMFAGMAAVLTYRARQA